MRKEQAIIRVMKAMGLVCKQCGGSGVVVDSRYGFRRFGPIGAGEMVFRHDQSYTATDCPNLKEHEWSGERSAPKEIAFHT